MTILTDGDADMLVTVVERLHRDVENLKASLEYFTPQNEFGLTEEQCWAATRALHISRHHDCPLLRDDLEGCRGFAREWNTHKLSQPMARPFLYHDDANLLGISA